MDRSGARRSPLDCRECGSRLGVDQRYCVECGTRARPLPRHIRLTLVAISRGHRWTQWPQAGMPATAGPAVTAEPSLAGVGADAPRPDRPWYDLRSIELPSPRAAAASVLGLLAFGVVVGSGAVGLANSPLSVTVGGLGSGAHVSAPLAATTTGGGDNGGGGSGGGGGGGGGGGSSSGGGSNSSAPTNDTSGGNTSTTPTSTLPTSTSALPPIKHVWVITMGTQSYNKAFSAAGGDAYLSKTLAKQGEIVSQYFGVTQGELANEIAMISGQGPTPQTEANCAEFSRISPGKVVHPYSQVSGHGCVYPKQTPTLVSELTKKHDTWRAYVEGLGAVVKLPPAPHRSTGNANTSATTGMKRKATRRAARAARGSRARSAIKRLGTVNAASCRHPALGSADRFQTAAAKDPYVTWRDPFVYFQSVTKSAACNDDVVGLPALTTDLKSVSTTPSVSFIYPDPCQDGSTTPCYRGAKAGSKPADAFLKSVVPGIMASAAYKGGGLILITFAQAPQTGAAADSNSCCDNPTTYPNLPAPGTTTTTATTTPGVTTTPTGTTTSPYDMQMPTTTTTTPTTTGTDGSCSSTGTTTTPGTTTTTTPGVTTTPGTTTSPYDMPMTTTTQTTTTPATTTPCTVPAGGQVGLLAISPYITPSGSDFIDSFNHFSLLASLEQLFHLKRLGYAADSQLATFGASFYTAYTPS